MSVFKSLEENEKSTFLEVTEILLKVLDNIIKAPNNLKFRKLRLSNEIVSNKLIPAIGALECLFTFGFEEAEDSLMLPQNVPLSRIKTMRENFDRWRKGYIKTLEKNMLVLTKFESTNSLLKEIIAKSIHVQLYENKDLQAAARKEVPIDELKRRRDAITNDNSTEFELEFGLLIELMKWFKSDFFQWMNSPFCKKCNSSSTFQGYSSDNEDLLHTDRVEVFNCDTCKDRLTFPRYNNPSLLLKSRTGRCGEWANCFTLLCRSLNYETRFVLDKTDHVWTEVYSQTLQKWIHCDPCENKIDAPLMYEKGWNKRLSYVIAFSNEEVQDVTWRYTTNFNEVRSRRNLCSEEDLLRLILQISNELQMSLPQERKDYLLKRRVMECAQFLTPQKTDQEYDGRISGSLQWRLSRNEYKLSTSKHTWIVNETEKERKRFCLRYSTATDMYQRVETNEIVKGWENGVFEFESIFRKIENDWKMCYLCRSENSDCGTIRWKFSSEKQRLHIDRVKIKYQSSTFHSGIVRLILCNEETCLPLKRTDGIIETDSFRGSYDLTLTAMLSNGDGTDAWQHAQLFRQLINSDQPVFEITITFTS